MRNIELKKIKVCVDRPKSYTSIPSIAPGDRFLKGPIPLSWIIAAAKLRGHAFQMGLLIWFRVGLEGQNSVIVSRAKSSLFGIKKDSATRALNDLIDAKLIEVERRPGCAPLVRLLPAPSPLPGEIGDKGGGS